MVLLKANTESGTVYIRTDQLDGETDWKLRKPIERTKRCSNIKEFKMEVGLDEVTVMPPNDNVNDFIAQFKPVSDGGETAKA